MDFLAKHQQRIDEIEKKVSQMQANGTSAMDIWVERRREHLGATDFAVLMGMSKWKTPYALWEEKMFGKNDTDPNAPALYWGRTLEPVLRAEYEKRRKVEVKEYDSLINSDFPYFAGSVDGIVYENGKPERILEIKTTRQNYATEFIDETGHAVMAWGHGNKYDEQGNCVLEDNQVPDAYLLQTYVYMLVTGLRKADICVLLSTSDFRIFTVEANNEVIVEMIKQATAFWENHVLTGVPPMRTESDLKNIEPEKASKTIASDEVMSTVKLLKEVQAKKKELSNKESELKDIIINSIGTNEELVAKDDTRLCTYKMQAGREQFDTENFKIDHPELFTKYMSRGQGFRVLRFTKGK